ncbi:MAG: hypothetical protein AABZ60_00185, partial [Planctomycetota bacterium]
PDFEAMYHARAVLLRKLKKLPEAIQDYQRLTILAPQKASIWYQLALLCEEMEQGEETKKYLKQAYLLSPESEYQKKLLDLLLKECKRYFQENDLRKAKESLEEFLKFAPSEHPDRARIQKLLQQLHDK